MEEPSITLTITSYYSDYNFKGRKVYYDNLPCCAGTLPQVAADYRINAYFRDASGVYINLYIPSTLRWKLGNVQLGLTQSGAYPLDSVVQFELSSSQSLEFALRFRIPSWAQGASVSVNGKQIPEIVTPGRFVSVRRRWKSGDHIDLDLPLVKRLEPIDKQHPNTVALLSGPLVLFAMTDAVPAVTKKQLLAARKTGPQSWLAETEATTLSLLPFTAISDQQYSTYVAVE